MSAVDAKKPLIVSVGKKPVSIGKKPVSIGVDAATAATSSRWLLVSNELHRVLDDTLLPPLRQIAADYLKLTRTPYISPVLDSLIGYLVFSFF